MRIRLADGRRRRLTLEEAKRLQSFPDWFEVIGGEASTFNQIGNAVAPLMAYELAGMVRGYLDSSERFPKSKIAAKRIPVQASLLMDSDVAPR